MKCVLFLLPFFSMTKRILQALSAISADDDLSQRCLHKLQVICSHHVVLSSAYIASGQIARVGDGPIALDAIADVWEGTYRNKKVLIRCLRAPLSDDQTVKKVRSQDGTSLSCLLKNTYGHRSYSPNRPSSGKG